ncbi:hypothetical protein J2T20_000084 [Paenibacillus wynnii]|nr:hypothetical protein [Paenibacillus wynnii]
MNLQNPARHLQAVHFGHPDIGNDNIRMGLFDEPDAFFPVLRSACDRDAVVLPRDLGGDYFHGTSDVINHT